MLGTINRIDKSIKGHANNNDVSQIFKKYSNEIYRISIIKKDTINAVQKDINIANIYLSYCCGSFFIINFYGNIQ